MTVALTVAAVMASRQIAEDPVINLVAGALITQLVLGLLAAIGFYAVVKRFMTTEFPAQISRIDKRLEDMDDHLVAIGRELNEVRRDVDRHEFQLRMNEQWRREQNGTQDLDDTRGGGPSLNRPRTRR